MITKFPIKDNYDKTIFQVLYNETDDSLKYEVKGKHGIQVIEEKELQRQINVVKKKHQ